MNPRPDDALLALYDDALARHGDTAQGALWPNEADRQRRYDVMLDVLADAPAGRRVLLCDLGCGTGGLLARLRERGLDHVDYRGIDRSAEAIRLARAKFPTTDFRVLDPLSEAADLLYHAMVGLTQRGLTLRQVIEVLAKRTHQSGHAEKASR